MTSLNTLLQRSEPETSLPQTLKSFQLAKRSALANVLTPTRKTENWKYSAKRLGDMTTQATATNTSADLGEQIGPNTIVIENGLVKESSIDIAGITLKKFSALNEQEAELVTQGVIARSDGLQFAQLNHAQFADGLFISIADNTKAEQPLRIIVRHTGTGTSYSRVFVSLGKLANITLIEELKFADLHGATALLNCVTDCALGDDSRMNYIRSDMDQQEQSKIIGATGVYLKRDSFFESHCLGLGTQLDRHDFRVEMAEPGAECNLNGVCVTQHKQHYDNHTCVDHIAPNCQSNESYRCIAGDESQIVFNGRIHIHRDAQKTLGSMSNKNLLLSNSAEIDSKPELEIYADDVKCAHGTTIGQLDEQEVYYLKTRGIKDEQARQMLTLGFVLELVRANPVAEIAEQWENKLAALLSFEP